MEVILAIAIFGLFAAAISTYALGGLVGQQTGADHVQAELLAQQGIEAVRAIRDRAFNENTYNQSAIQNTSNQWFYTGEGTSETIGKFTRTITFSAVCRNSTKDIVTCPGTYTDAQSKKATVTISWSPRLGITDQVQQITYLTTWKSQDWTQTDWSGGSGQAMWSSATRYDSDDSNVNVSTAGQAQLASAGGTSWNSFGSTITDTTDTNFNAGTNIATKVTGSGTAGAVVTFSPLTTNILNDVSFDSSTDGFAVGATGVIYHYTGTDWVSTASPTAGIGLNSVSMVSSTDGWAVGDDQAGAISAALIHWNGTAWSSVTSPSADKINLNAIHMRTASDGWAVGDKGEVMRWNGTAWSHFGSLTGNNQLSIYMVSATDGWTADNKGLMRRFNGTTWSTVTSSTTQPINSIYAVNANDVWAAASSGQILHWNGTAWSTFVDTGGETWNSIYMVSATDGWIVGSTGVIRRYVGGAWVAQTSPTTVNLFSVKMLSATDGWIVGATGSDVLRFDPNRSQFVPGAFYSRVLDAGAEATHWGSMIYSATIPSGAGVTIATRSGSTSTPDGTWSAFTTDCATPSPASCAVGSPNHRYLQYRVSFTIGAAITAPQFLDVAFLLNKSSYESLYSVSPVSSTNVWSMGSNGAIQQFDGTNWNLITAPSVNTTQSVFMRTATDGWAVGANGLIWRTTNGTSWSLFVDTGTQNWNSVYMVSATSGWAVSDDTSGGTPAAIARWNGTTWTAANAPTADFINLESVYMLSNTDGWAAGGSGKIIHWNGTAWTVFATTGAQTWNEIHMIDDRNGWVVGSGGAIYRYTDATNDSVVNGTWASFTSPVATDLESLHFFSATNGWAVGLAGHIIQWNGTAWSSVTSPTSEDLYSVRMLSATSAWAVGNNGTILRLLATGNFVASGNLTSSAFNAGATSAFNSIEWDQTIPSCSPTCTIRLQVRSAPNNAGVPGTWSSWYGATGANTYFTVNTGNLLTTALNGNQWVQYRFYLDGDTVSTPTVSEVRLNYKNN